MTTKEKIIDMIDAADQPGTLTVREQEKLALLLNNMATENMIMELELVSMSAHLAGVEPHTSGDAALHLRKFLKSNRMTRARHEFEQLVMAALSTDKWGHVKNYINNNWRA
jgi:hypothetical protein